MANLFQAWDEDIQALGAAKASDDQIEARRQQLAEHFKAKAKAAGLSSKKIYETLDQFDTYSRQKTTAQDDQLTPEEQEMAQRVKDGTVGAGAIKEVGKRFKDVGLGVVSSLTRMGGDVAQTINDVSDNDKTTLSGQIAQGLYNATDDIRSNYSEGTKTAKKDFWSPEGLTMGVAENLGQIAGTAALLGTGGAAAGALGVTSKAGKLATMAGMAAPLAYSQGYGQGKENSLDEINKTSNAQLWENVKAEVKAYDDAGGTGEVPYLVGMFKEAGGDLNLMKDLMAENAGNRSGIMTVATEPLAMGVGSVMSRGAAAGGTGVMAKFANAMNNQGMSNELARRIAAGASAAEARKAGQIVGTTALRDNAAIASQAGKIAATQMAREGVQETAQEGLEGYYAKGEGSRAAGRKGELNSADWSGENGIIQQGLQGGAIGMIMGAGGAGATLRNSSKLALEKNGLPEKHDAAIIAHEQAIANLEKATQILDLNPEDVKAQEVHAKAYDEALVATNNLEQLTGKFNALYTPEEQEVIKAKTMEGIAARKKVADDAAKAQKELDDAQAKEQADIAAQQAEAIKTQRDAVVNNLAGMVGDDVALSNAVADLGLSEEEANSLLDDAHKVAKKQKKEAAKQPAPATATPKTPFEMAVDEAFNADGTRNPKAMSSDIAKKHNIPLKPLVDAISERIDSNSAKNKAAANEALAQKRQKEKLENTLADFAANNDHDSMVNFLRDYEPTEADKLIKNAYASVENKKKAEQDAIAATKKAEALKVKESEAKTQAEQKKIAFNNDMANLYAANPDRNPTKAELDSVGKKHGVKSPIELAQAWVKAKNEAKAAPKKKETLALPAPENVMVTDAQGDISVVNKNDVPKGLNNSYADAPTKISADLNINRDNIENQDRRPIIVRTDGQPFQTQEAAEQAIKNKSKKPRKKKEKPITPETHKVISVNGGFAIAPVVEIQQPKKPDDNEDGGVIADAPKPNAPVSPTGQANPINVNSATIGTGSQDYADKLLAPAKKALADGNYSEHTTKTGEKIRLVIAEDNKSEAVIFAFDEKGSRPVATMTYSKYDENGTRFNPTIEVDNSLRRQGIATAMYKLAEQNGGLIPDLNQKGQARSDDGQKFRESMVTPEAQIERKEAQTQQETIEDDGIKTKHIKQPKPADRTVYPHRDDLLTAIAKIKGLNKAQAIYYGIKDSLELNKRGRGLLGVFKEDGRGFDVIARELSDMGYPVNEGGNTPYDNINGTPTPDALLDALRKALFGEDVGTEEYILNKYAAQREADQKEAEEMERLFNGKGSSTWDEADALDNVSNAIVDDIVSGTSGIAPEKLSETLKEVSNEPIIEIGGQAPNAKTEARSPQNGDAETTGTGKTGQQESQSSTGQDSGIGLNPSFNLNAQTNEELAKRDADNKAAEAKRQAEEKAAKDKAQADKEVSDFRLSGSNSPADIAMAGGQNDMFAAPTRGEREAEKAKTEQSDNQKLKSILDDLLSLRDAKKETSVFIADDGKKYNKVQKSVSGKLSKKQYEEIKGIVGLKNTITIENTETKNSGINLTAKTTSEYGSFYAFSTEYTPVSTSPENINETKAKTGIIKEEYPTATVLNGWQNSSRNVNDLVRSFKRAYEDYINEAYNGALSQAETDAQKKVLEKESLKLQKEYIKRVITLAKVRSGVTSSFIAGGSNFNNKQAQNRGNAFDKASQDFDNWLLGNKYTLSTAVQEARSPEQLAAIQAEKDAKAQKLQDKNDAFLRKVLSFKKGDDFTIGKNKVVRVNVNKYGMPISLTLEGDGITKGLNDKISLYGRDMSYETIDELKQNIERIKEADSNAQAKVKQEENPTAKAMTADQSKYLAKQAAILEELSNKNAAIAMRGRSTSRAQATTKSANMWRNAAKMDSLKETVRREMRKWQQEGYTLDNIPTAFNSLYLYNDQGNYDPIKVVETASVQPVKSQDSVVKKPVQPLPSNETIHLQGIGKHPAIMAGDVKIGDSIVFNFGSTAVVKSITSTDKMVDFTFENGDEMQFKKTRLVGYIAKAITGKHISPTGAEWSHESLAEFIMSKEQSQSAKPTPVTQPESKSTPVASTSSSDLSDEEYIALQKAYNDFKAKTDKINATYSRDVALEIATGLVAEMPDKEDKIRQALIDAIRENQWNRFEINFPKQPIKVETDVELNRALKRLQKALEGTDYTVNGTFNGKSAKLLFSYKSGANGSRESVIIDRINGKFTSYHVDFDNMSREFLKPLMDATVKWLNGEEIPKMKLGDDSQWDYTTLLSTPRHIDNAFNEAKANAPTAAPVSKSDKLAQSYNEAKAKQQPAKEEAPKQEANSKTPTLDKHNALNARMVIIDKQDSDSQVNEDKPKFSRKATESDSVPIYRIDNKNFDANNIKPHGLYVSIPSDVSTFDSPHKDVGDTSFAGNASPKNPLNVESFKIQHKRGNDYPMEVSAGVSALKQLVSVQLFERLIKANKAELTATIKEQFPDIDTSQYYDAYELLEVLGAQLAIQEGYDAIIQKNGNDPFNEMVILDNSIIESMSPTDKPKNSKGTGEGLTTTQTRTILVKHFGEKVIKALESSGLLTIMATPPSWAEPDADGAYDKDSGKAYLFTDNLSAETVVATLAHELSGHKGFQELMTPTAYDSLMRQFNRLVKQGNAVALAAKARAEAAESTLGAQQDEYLPYLLTQQATLNATRSQQSAVTKVIEQVYRAVKAWLYRTLSAKGYDGLASKLLQPKDITLLAERMIREMGNGTNPNSNTKGKSQQGMARRDFVKLLAVGSATISAAGVINFLDGKVDNTKSDAIKSVVDEALPELLNKLNPSENFLKVLDRAIDNLPSNAIKTSSKDAVDNAIQSLRASILYFSNFKQNKVIETNLRDRITGTPFYINYDDLEATLHEMMNTIESNREVIEKQIALSASFVEGITGVKLKKFDIFSPEDSGIIHYMSKVDDAKSGKDKFVDIGAETYIKGIELNPEILIRLISTDRQKQLSAFQTLSHELTHVIQNQTKSQLEQDNARKGISQKDSPIGVDTFIPEGIENIHKKYLERQYEGSSVLKEELEGFNVGYTAAKAWLRKNNMPLRIASKQDIIERLEAAEKMSVDKKDLLDKFGYQPTYDSVMFSQLNTPQTQINAVRRKYEGTSQWMKAPNGQPTKLNEMQWLQVRTPNFKAWFGDWENDPKNASQVVDSNGEPMVVYHGTEYGGFTEFGSSGYGAASREKGFWFSNKIRALEYSGKNQEIEIVPVLKSWSDAAYFAKKLDVEFKKAPEDEYDDGIYFIDDDIASTLNQARNILQKAIEDKQPAGIYPVFLSLKTPKTINAKGKLATNINTLVMSNVPKKYDGMMIVDVDDAGRFGDYGYITDNYVAKTSTQIKSATDNTGEFNPTNPDIRFSRKAKNPITEGIKSAANDAKNSLPDPIAKSIDNFMAGRRLPSSDMANITAKTELSIYKRTIGTQLNTALQLPDFKKVYDMAQRYLQHVAVDAYAALKVAPNLLGKLESWSDLKKDVKKIWPANFIKQKADRAAVASIIFDETLNNELLSDADILKALTRDQRQIYKEARDAIQVSLENTAKSEMVRKLLAAEAINWSTVESMINQDLPVEQFAQTVRDMVESRIGGFKNELDAILDADPKIKEAFKTGNKNKLIPAQKKELKKALTLKAQIETTEEALKSLNDVEARLETLIEQGYAPLMRFGEYTLTVRDLDGKVKSFFMFESKSEQVRAVNTIVARYGKTVNLETDMISKEEFKQFAGMTPETVALFAKETGMDKDEAYQHYLKHAIPARSAMTRMIKRKGTEGFSDDIQRVVASFVMSNARMSAKNIYAAQIEKSIQDIESGKSVKDQAYVMKENVFNPKENFAQLRNFLFLWNLGGSIFFGLLNMTQPYMQTLPHLSQYVPIGDATRAILRGSKIAGSAMKNGTAPKGYEAEYNRAVREGVVDPQNVFMLSGVERGKTGASNSAWGVITHTMGLIAQVTESFNRKAVFIASLQVAKQKGDVWLKKKGFNSAYDFAKDSVDQTQGVYDKANRSNWANTSVGAPLMVFKQFSINYVEQMVRMWKKEAASGDEGKKAVFLMLAMLASLSGMMALPFIKDFLDVSETTAAFLGHPVNLEREARLMLGKDVADPLFNGVLNHFVFNQFGMDIQSRTGMPDLVPWSNALNPTLSAQGRINEFASIAGATGGLIEKGYDATQLIARDEYGAAAKTLAPRFLTSWIDGGKMALTNEVMDRKGNKLFDTTWDEGLVKFIDANPKRMADLSRTKSLEWKDKSIQDYMTTSFKQKLINAMMDKDQAEVNNLMVKVKAWNDARPHYPIYIDLNNIAKAANKKDQTFDARESIPKGQEWWKAERPEM